MKEWLLGIAGDVASGIIVNISEDVTGEKRDHLIMLLGILLVIVVFLAVLFAVDFRRQIKTRNRASAGFRERAKRLRQYAAGIIGVLCLMVVLVVTNVVHIVDSTKSVDGGNSTEEEQSGTLTETDASVPGGNGTEGESPVGGNGTEGESSVGGNGTEGESPVGDNGTEGESSVADNGPEEETMADGEERSGEERPEETAEEAGDSSYVHGSAAAMELTDDFFRELSSDELAALFFGMPEEGWSDYQKVYPLVCERLDMLFEERREEKRPLEGSAEEVELKFLTKTADLIRECIESIRKIDRENYRGTEAGYKNLPDDTVILDIIEVREEFLRDYPCVELYRLLSYDYQMMADEYVNQNGDPDQELYYYGRAILSLGEALTFKNITPESETGQEILRYMKVVYENIGFSPQLSAPYCKSAAVIAKAIEQYMEAA